MIYLNTASRGIPPRRSVEAIVDYVQTLARNPVEVDDEKAESSLREEYAKFVGTTADAISISGSGTMDGVFTALRLLGPRTILAHDLDYRLSLGCFPRDFHLAHSPLLRAMGSWAAVEADGKGLPSTDSLTELGA